MKRLLTSIAFVLAAAAGQAAQANWLYWSIAEAKTSEGDAVEFHYAVLCASADLTKAYTVGTEGGWKVRSNADARSTPAVASNIGEPADGADGFAVLLYNAANEIVAVSETVSRGALVKHIYVDLRTAGEGTPYAFSTFGAIPEPSGGLLLALGVCALALRRRNGGGD